MYTILKELNESSTVIEASAIITKDGLVIAALLPERINGEHLGTLSAGASTLGKFTSGALNQILIKCVNNNVVVAQLAEDLLLAVILKPESSPTLIDAAIKDSSKKITRILADTKFYLT